MIEFLILSTARLWTFEKQRLLTNASSFFGSATNACSR